MHKQCLFFIKNEYIWYVGNQTKNIQHEMSRVWLVRFISDTTRSSILDSISISMPQELICAHIAMTSHDRRDVWNYRQINRVLNTHPALYHCPFFMMTSSNGNIFRVTGPLCGEFTGPGEFPTQRPVTRSFDVFFDRRLNKRSSKQPRGWW